MSGGCSGMPSLRILAGAAAMAGVTLAAALAFVAVHATAAPTPLVLTFDGAHFLDNTVPDGLRHDGRFTASAPLCPAGRAYDARHLEGQPLSVLRLHTCD